VQPPGGSISSSGYDVLVGELVEQQNWLLCAVMTLCGQADVCTSTADNSDIIPGHIFLLQACWNLYLLLSTSVYLVHIRLLSCRNNQQVST